MLQWTCRLRDVLERERFHSRSSCLSGLRELEFSNQDTFAEGLRWENLVESLNDGCHCLHRNDGKIDCCCGPLIDPTCREYGSIRALSGESIPDLSQHKFDVLWLSPTVFISRLYFYINMRNCSEYSICFERRHSKVTRCHVYLLSCFEEEAVSVTPSLCPLPLSFFRNLVADLPADYFTRICLDDLNPQPGAGNFYTQFLSIIRYDAPLGATAKGDSGTIFVLKGAISSDDLSVIFSHQFNPFVRLSFQENRFYTLVTFSDFNSLLRESRYLRALDLPLPPTERNGSNLLLSYQMILRSERLSIYYSGLISMTVLHAISLIHRLVDIRIECCLYDRTPQKLAQEFASFFRSLLQEGSSLQRLRVALALDSGQMLLEIIDTFAACFSKKLNLVCIRSEVIGSDSSQVFAHVKPWDVGLFPTVALNCYQVYLKKHLIGGVVPWAIQAVNKGHLYRRATSHAAFDMSIANAGVIFCIARKFASKQSSVKLRAARLALRGEADADVAQSSSIVEQNEEGLIMTEPGWNLVKGKKRSANRKSSNQDKQKDVLS
jgi:hypothetical protein